MISLRPLKLGVGVLWVTIAKMVGDFSGISNLVVDRSPMTPTVVQPLDLNESRVQ